MYRFKKYMWLHKYQKFVFTKDIQIFTKYYFFLSLFKNMKYIQLYYSLYMYDKLIKIKLIFLLIILQINSRLKIIILKVKIYTYDFQETYFTEFIINKLKII